MNKVMVKENNMDDIQVRFLWKDSKERFHDPKKMRTKHLFFTLRMIWNHSMPEQMKLRPYMEYTFSEYYTVEYIITAISVIGKELLSRKDLLPEWEKELTYMKNCFNAFEHKKRATATQLLFTHI